MNDAFLITCEHGGNRVPPAYRHLFRARQSLLESHRGYDSGALRMAGNLATALGAPLVSSTVSRLLVDLNRSIGHPQLFSPAMRAAPAGLREQVIAEYYRPYRDGVGRLVARWVSRGRRVIHIGSHSFTPVLDGRRRSADVGLLYDPGRRGEVALCARWQASLAAMAPDLRVRRNYPYAGRGDGLTADLRTRYPPRTYMGIELEVNQAIVVAGGRRWAALRAALVESLHAACAA